MTDLQALLDRIDRLDQRATKGPWEIDGDGIDSKTTFDEVVSTEVDCGTYCMGGTGKGIEDDSDAEFIAMARTALPQLAKALQAVIELHKPVKLYPAVTPAVIYCHSCWDSVQDEAIEHPCDTYQALTDALEADDETH